MLSTAGVSRDAQLHPPVYLGFNFLLLGFVTPRCPSVTHEVHVDRYHVCPFFISPHLLSVWLQQRQDVRHAVRQASCAAIASQTRLAAPGSVYGSCGSVSVGGAETGLHCLGVANSPFPLSPIVPRLPIYRSTVVTSSEMRMYPSPIYFALRVCVRCVMHTDNCIIRCQHRQRFG